MVYMCDSYLRYFEACDDGGDPWRLVGLNDVARVLQSLGNGTGCDKNTLLLMFLIRIFFMKDCFALPTVRALQWNDWLGYGMGVGSAASFCCAPVPRPLLCPRPLLRPRTATTCAPCYAILELHRRYDISAMHPAIQKMNI